MALTHTAREFRLPVRVCWTLALLLGGSGLAAAECPAPEPGAPRTLILTLDGIAHRHMVQARERGSYEGWSSPRPLISTFPSMTNVGFTAIFRPFGMGTIPGYEMRHYQYEANTVYGGMANYKERSMGWRDYYDVISRSNKAKAGTYLRPGHKALHMMDEVQEFVLAHPHELMLGHIDSTDALAHFGGDEPVVDLLVRMEERVQGLRRRHEELYGRPLHVVMLSDHGNTLAKVDARGGIQDLLRGAGFRVSEKLDGPEDVVPMTYGVVNYGALFLSPDRAEDAARAVLAHSAVNLVAWIVEPGHVHLLSPAGEGEVRWSGELPDRNVAYDPGDGDPLRLAAAVASMRAAGTLDAEGFADEAAWLAATASAEFPDAPRRVVDSLTDTWVANPATVIFSMDVGYAWGRNSAKFGAFMRGGKLEGTHGGLDSASTIGFFMTSDPATGGEGPVAADHALDPWAPLVNCLSTRIDPRQLADAVAAPGADSTGE